MVRETFRGYNRVKFQSIKLGRPVLCQSLLLRDYLLSLEWDTDVKSYELRPFKITYFENGHRRLFRPHLLFDTWSNEKTAVWLKSSIDDEDVHSRMVRLISDICVRSDLKFSVITSAEIRREPFFSNLQILRRYKRTEITSDHISLCNEVFCRINTPLLGDLIECLLLRDQDPGAAFAFLASRIIEADFHNLPVNFDLPITLTKPVPDYENGRNSL
jgi:hypothetical protein